LVAITIGSVQFGIAKCIFGKDNSSLEALAREFAYVNMMQLDNLLERHLEQYALDLVEGWLQFCEII